MKTLRFGRIDIEILMDGEVMLVVKAPGQTETILQLTPDELMMFLTDVGNSLADSRELQVKLQQLKDLQNEKNRQAIKGYEAGEERTDTEEGLR